MDRRAWQATVHGGHKQSDTTEQLTHTKHREINSEYSLEGLMLKLQYFDHLM